MDWKRFYRAELDSEVGRQQVADALRRHSRGQAALVETLRAGGVLSFPHTTLGASAAPIARTVAALRDVGADRVVALGVLHGAALPEPLRGLHEAYASWLTSGADGSELVQEIFEELGGAFFSRAALHTPWGEVPLADLPPESEVLRERSALLASEFSLDLFLGVLAADARQRGTAPVPVVPLYVSLTRNPQGSFRAASRLAETLRALCRGRTAVVTTGDLVHYGNGYSSAEEMARLPAAGEGIESHFRARLDAALDAALAGRDYETFYVESLTGLKNDQRNVLPVIAEFLAPRAAHRVLSFELTDYSRIRGLEPPCLVASALVSYLAGAAQTPLSTSRQFS